MEGRLSVPGDGCRYSIPFIAREDCETRLVRLMALRLGGSVKQHDLSALQADGFA